MTFGPFAIRRARFIHYYRAPHTAAVGIIDPSESAGAGETWFGRARCIMTTGAGTENTVDLNYNMPLGAAAGKTGRGRWVEFKRNSC